MPPLLADWWIRCMAATKAATERNAAKTVTPRDPGKTWIVTASVWTAPTTTAPAAPASEETCSLTVRRWSRMIHAGHAWRTNRWRGIVARVARAWTRTAPPTETQSAPKWRREVPDFVRVRSTREFAVRVAKEFERGFRWFVVRRRTSCYENDTIDDVLYVTDNNHSAEDSDDSDDSYED